MSGRALVDTNVVIALFAGDPAIVEKLRHRTAVFLCAPVVGELRYGALASARVDSNIARLNQFAEALVVLACDSGTAVSYATMKFSLRRKGRPIPENDVWIASLAHQHNLILLTRDEHFLELDDLKVEVI